MDEPPIDPRTLKTYLDVLSDYENIKSFKCPLFTVTFADPEPEPDPTITEIKGFLAKKREEEQRDKDGDTTPEELRAQHARALKVPLPLLNPPTKKG